MEFATAQNQPFLAAFVVVCLVALGVWTARRRQRQRLLGRHQGALLALQQLREHTASQAAKSPHAPEAPPARPDIAARGRPAPDAPVAEPGQGTRSYTGLARSQAHLYGRLAALFGDQRRPLDEAAKQAIEEILLTSDLGVAQTDRLLTALTEAAGLAGNSLSAAEVRVLMRAELLRVLTPATQTTPPLDLGALRPAVWLFVGVNGVGKTTTIGKLAHALKAAGHRPLLAAGDTYRAAAAEQLAIWASRSDARLVRGEPGADPASVAYNALAAAHKDGQDVVLFDTAGRLHTQRDLMQQLQKVRRALAKQRPSAPDETWLVVDATTGQNALQQAKAFHQDLGLTGIVLTKLDGSAKGGIVVAIAEATGVPVRFVGLGEQITDLRPFDAQAFVEALI